ncbi:MAG: IS110 family transposase [Anaerolineae bacterium]|nr:IS110 family transposase [Anaerolineae bacterium]
MNNVLGIDIAKESFVVVLVVGETRQQAEFPNAPAGYERLDRWLKKRQVKTVHACLEATGRYGDELAWWLHEAGHTVSVLNPARLKAYAQSRLSRTKTDGVDAGLLADFCLTQQPEAWTPPDPAWRELQAMVRQLDALQATRQQELNRLGANPPSAVVRATIDAHVAFLEAQIKALKAQIRSHIDQHPDLKVQHDLLTSIPGIGDTTADLILAEVRDLRAFDDAGQVVAYAGLNPRQRQSGKSVHGHSPLSKCGNARLRKALYMPALVAQRFNPCIQAFCQRLAANGKSKMVVVGAAMRKLLVLAYGVVKSGRPFDPARFAPPHP